MKIRGFGAFARSTFESAYAGAFTTAKANWQASADYADIVNKAQLAGASAPVATGWGDLYASRRADEDAQDVAWAAADPASQWVTIGRYGSGANPVIDGQGTQEYGFLIDSEGAGGVKIQDLEIKNMTRVGLYMLGGGDFNGQSHTLPLNFDASGNGFALLRTYIHDVALPYLPPHPQVPLPIYNTFCAQGALVSGVNFVRFENNIFNSTDQPWYLVFGRHFMLRDNAATLSYWEHPVNSYANNVTLVRTTVANMCNRGYPDGSAGIFFALLKDMSFRLGSVTATRRNVSPIDGQVTPDGIGIDFEAHIENGLVEGITVGGAGSDANDGSAALVFANPGVTNPPGVGHGANIWRGNTFTRNGLTGTVTGARVYTTFPAQANPGTAIWFDNTTTKPTPSAGANNLFWQSVTVGQSGSFSTPIPYLCYSTNMARDCN